MIVNEPKVTPFDAWLLDELARRNLSGSVLARRIHVPLDTVVSWLYAAAAPGEQDVAALADVLNLKIGDVRRALTHR